ncbi:hypothetical protein SAMN05660991_00489 [Trujillonella endophytica]|uniref:Uncharacterized protein n=2 Tax=Trujillonella endophytica TaxID=673521 RepID=A0A1H8Q0W4_9ACTN|nr:hypothetical protein SAMN05660991_00489 [Trujillella endophytica]
MEWVGLAGMGFLAATAVVIALARASTARWERESEEHPRRVVRRRSRARHRRPAGDRSPLPR